MTTQTVEQLEYAAYQKELEAVLKRIDLETMEAPGGGGLHFLCPNCSRMYPCVGADLPLACKRCSCPMDFDEAYVWAEAQAKLAQASPVERRRQPKARIEESKARARSSRSGRGSLQEGPAEAGTEEASEEDSGETD